MIQEFSELKLRVNLALKPVPFSLFSRICRVQFLFPDLGNLPLIYRIGFERFHPLQKISIMPSGAQVLTHLNTLTTFQP